MFEMSGDFKTLIDIGLGAMALLLWFRQGKVNKDQAQTNKVQADTNQKLTTMVADHEVRLTALESVRRHAKVKPRR